MNRKLKNFLFDLISSRQGLLPAARSGINPAHFLATTMFNFMSVLGRRPKPIVNQPYSMRFYFRRLVRGRLGGVGYKALNFFSKSSLLGLESPFDSFVCLVNHDCYQ